VTKGGTHGTKGTNSNCRPQIGTMCCKNTTLGALFLVKTEGPWTRYNVRKHSLFESGPGERGEMVSALIGAGLSTELSTTANQPVGRHYHPARDRRLVFPASLVRGPQPIGIATPIQRMPQVSHADDSFNEGQ
jgi:hypothetical protein